MDNYQHRYSLSIAISISWTLLFWPRVQAQGYPYPGPVAYPGPNIPSPAYPGPEYGTPTDQAPYVVVPTDTETPRVDLFTATLEWASWTPTPTPTATTTTTSVATSSYPGPTPSSQDMANSIATDIPPDETTADSIDPPLIGPAPAVVYVTTIVEVLIEVRNELTIIVNTNSSDTTITNVATTLIDAATSQIRAGQQLQSELERVQRNPETLRGRPGIDVASIHRDIAACAGTLDHARETLDRVAPSTSHDRLSDLIDKMSEANGNFTTLGDWLKRREEDAAIHETKQDMMSTNHHKDDITLSWLGILVAIFGIAIGVVIAFGSDRSKS